MCCKDHVWVFFFSSTGNSDDLNTLPLHLHSDLLNAPLIPCLVNLISIFQQVDEWLNAACDSHVFHSVKYLLVNTHRKSSSAQSDFNLEVKWEGEQVFLGGGWRGVVLSGAGVLAVQTSYKDTHTHALNSTVPGACVKC